VQAAVVYVPRTVAARIAHFGFYRLAPPQPPSGKAGAAGVGSPARAAATGLRRPRPPAESDAAASASDCPSDSDSEAGSAVGLSDLEAPLSDPADGSDGGCEGAEGSAAPPAAASGGAHPNQRLLDAFQGLLESYSAKVTDEGQFRMRTTEKTIKFLRQSTAAAPLHTVADFERLLEGLSKLQRTAAGLGRKTCTKIREIITTGTARRIEALAGDSAIAALSAFNKIWGVGTFRAKALVQQGILTMDALRLRVLGDAATGVAPNPPVFPGTGGGGGVGRRHGPILDDDSVACLHHFDDMQHRIPRAEVEEIVAAVQAAALQLFPANDLFLTCCGSYRRGQASSGDVDILLAPRSRPGSPAAPGRAFGYFYPLQELVRSLKASGFVVRELKEGQRLDFEEARSKGKGRHARVECIRRAWDAAEVARGERPAEGTEAFEHPPPQAYAAQGPGLLSLVMEQRRVVVTETADRGYSALRKYRVYSAEEAEEAVAAAQEQARRVQWLECPEYHHEMRMFLVRLPGPGRRVRRLDLKSYPNECLAFALLSFTGSDYFNRSLRYFVDLCGWKLTDTGLRPAFRAVARGATEVEVQTEGASVRCDTEEDVFAAVGLQFRPPHMRDLGAPPTVVVRKGKIVARKRAKPTIEAEHTGVLPRQV
jgi:DNA polymerase/3'-5' exonuclease PolX